MSTTNTNKNKRGQPILSAREFWKQKRQDEERATKCLEIIMRLLCSADTEIKNPPLVRGSDNQTMSLRSIEIVVPFGELGMKDPNDGPNSLAEGSILNIVTARLLFLGYSCEYLDFNGEVIHGMQQFGEFPYRKAASLRVSTSER